MPHPPSSVESVDRRWNPVLRGLRLASSPFGIGAIGGFYALWCVIGLILGLAFIPFVALGKVDAFTTALNPVAKYGFVLPMGLIASMTWISKFVARLLICTIPKPSAMRALAYVSALGRFSVLAGMVMFWTSGETLTKGLLLPGILACSGIAWLGLFAEWVFNRTLRSTSGTTIPPGNELQPIPDSGNPSASAGKGVFTRDVGDWFAGRFPRAHRILARAFWILFPVLYVVASSLAQNGDLHALGDPLLRLAVVAPIFLQIFWIPRAALAEAIDVVSRKVA
jgi:hypothetical protein